MCWFPTRLPHHSGRISPMDLRTQRLVRPGPDSAMLAPHHPHFLGAFSAQQFAQYTQQHLPEHIQFEYDREQIRQEKEKEKKQKLQQLMNKEKSEQSAVASPLVKQKLRSQILKRQEKERTTPTSSTPRGYRELAPDPDMALNPTGHRLPCDQGKNRPLRRTASEPILKVRSKLKKHLNFRHNPLQRKSSAPPTVKHRTPDTLDSSHSSSSTPASGCSSPNDSLFSDTPLSTGLSHEAQRSLAHFTVPCSSPLPTISAGLPARGHRELGGHQRVARVLPQVYLNMDTHSTLHQHLQPLLILEPSGLLHAQLVSVRGQVQYPSSRQDGLATLLLHRPLGRTCSEPPLSSQCQLLQPHSLRLESTLKQNTTQGPLMTNEKPRPSHSSWGDRAPAKIGSEEVDSYHRRRQTGAESQEDTDSTSSSDNQGDTRRHASHINKTFRWDQPRNNQLLPERRKHSSYLDTLGVPMVLGPLHRPLGRAQSSPASTSLPPSHPTDAPLSQASNGLEAPAKLRFTTGLVYDSQMMKHQCTCGDNSRHPEHAGRIQSIWSRLQERGLRNHCECIRSRKASMEELQSVHSEKHVLLYGTNPLNRLKLDNRILSQRVFVMLPCGGVGVDNDTVWNESHTSTASRLAAGSVTELALKVAQGELKNGFAVVRPPGHHATHATPSGFCFFNSVAIAAKQLQYKLNVSKILIVDWDVHHGNGTQSVFYSDPSVLYISLHRYDNGNFFPGSGDPAEVGAGAGKGFNVNVAWMGGLDPPMGDAEYLAAFRTVVMPIAHEFSPEVVLVSSGFDAVEGHPAPLGGYKVSAKCFGFLTRQLMGLAGGRVVMALEGGHDLTAICDASEACVSALLGVQVEPLCRSVLEKRPCPNAVLSLQTIIQTQDVYWKCLRKVEHTVDQSYMQAQEYSLRRESDAQDTVSALASLTMVTLTTNRTHRDESMEGDSDSM